MPELDGHHELSRWEIWLEELDGMDPEDLASDLEECVEYLDGCGWIEDERGDAVFVPYRSDP